MPRATASKPPAPKERVSKAQKQIAPSRALKKQAPRTSTPRGSSPIEEEVEEQQISQRSKLEKRKRDQAKAKAGKAFTKQFGNTSSSETTSGGTRAALYKGEMGRKHRQATRMQGSAGQGASASKKRGRISLNPRSPKFVASMMVAACLVISCAFLYPTAKQFYITSREHAQLAAEYDALQQRNAAIRSEVDMLTTEAGIEDRARKEFGWVKEGENAVNVYGLEEYDDTSTYNKAVLPGSVEAPATWYSPILDTLFGI